ncbi:MAG: hypothetical protein H0T79_11265, partial [Deltaproteobacteria bacterium]|nr:hypothetical protein [Deltaproteobacteria bacterium]
MVMLFVGKRRITPLEVVIQIAIVGCLIVYGYYSTRWSGIQDTEIWSGRIARTNVEGTRCCHSFKCNCRQECKTDAKKKTTCGEVCSTCYKHAGDTRYTATSSNGELVYSNGCNGPGETPTSWHAVKVGDTTAWEHP